MAAVLLKEKKPNLEKYMCIPCVFVFELYRSHTQLRTTRSHKEKKR